MKPPARDVITATELGEALARVDAHSGEPEDFRLAISETLLDPVGINMALLTDRILARGWEPDGFEQRTGYRIYLYKRLE